MAARIGDRVRIVRGHADDVGQVGYVLRVSESGGVDVALVEREDNWDCVALDQRDVEVIDHEQGLADASHVDNATDPLDAWDDAGREYQDGGADE